MVGANHLLHMQWQQPNTFNFLSWFPLSWKRVEADDKNHHDRNNNWKNDDDDDCIVFSCKIHEIIQL